jgi:hypothetical protein
MQSKKLLEVNKGLDPNERTDVTERGGQGAAETAIFQRKQLADKQPRDGTYT